MQTEITPINGINSYQAGPIEIHVPDEEDYVRTEAERLRKRGKRIITGVMSLGIAVLVYASSSWSYRDDDSSSASIWHSLNDSVMGGKSKSSATAWFPLDDEVMGGKSKTRTPIMWHPVDDGVMGGKSRTNKDFLNHMEDSDGFEPIAFAGRINTNGGGFASIRTKFDEGLPESVSAVRVTFRGDGKTYKVLLSDGHGGGPWSRTPVWEVDIPTEDRLSQDDAEPQTMTIPLADFVPRFAWKGPPKNSHYTLINSKMHQFGLMLSLLLMDGSPNPPETFGQGIFDFRLEVEDIRLV